MKSRGFILMECLVATLLFSLAGTTLYQGFVQGLRAERVIHKSFREYDPMRILFLRLEKDLRNSVDLKDYPFKGAQDRLEFPVRFLELDPEGRSETKILLVRYELKDQTLIRWEQELAARLRKEEPEDRVLLQELSSLEFQFPFEDKDGNFDFQPFWLDEPYDGIPRAVKLSLNHRGHSLMKSISIPQGHWGHDAHE